jgi:hypothetical protein
MQSDHVPFRIDHERNESIFPDCKFGLTHVSARVSHTFFFHRAIFTGKINQGAATTRILAFHFHQRTNAPRLPGASVQSSSSTIILVGDFHGRHQAGDTFVKCAGSGKIICGAYGEIFAF